LLAPLVLHWHLSSIFFKFSDNLFLKIDLPVPPGVLWFLVKQASLFCPAYEDVSDHLVLVIFWWLSAGWLFRFCSVHLSWTWRKRLNAEQLANRLGPPATSLPHPPTTKTPNQFNPGRAPQKSQCWKLITYVTPRLSLVQNPHSPLRQVAVSVSLFSVVKQHFVSFG